MGCLYLPDKASSAGGIRGHSAVSRSRPNSHTDKGRDGVAIKSEYGGISLLMSKPREIISAYLTALEANHLGGILSCFAPHALITSPTYGAMEAETFYKKLCADTVKTEISGIEIHASAVDSLTWFAQFDYQWSLRDGTTKLLTILDRFRIEGDSIGALRIFASSQGK